MSTSVPDSVVTLVLVFSEALPGHAGDKRSSGRVAGCKDGFSTRSATQATLIKAKPTVCMS
eukprot:8836568-Pyramimonas_sp.AAC.1